MENTFGIPASRFRVLLGTMEQRPKVVLTFVVLHNILRTHHGRPNRAQTQGDDIAVLQNEQLLYVPDDNYRNPSRKAKHQRDRLKDCFNHLGALAGLEDRI